MRIVNSDNFDTDYPDEQFVAGLPLMDERDAERVADAINACVPHSYPRYWRAVPNDYTLREVRL